MAYNNNNYSGGNRGGYGGNRGNGYGDNRNGGYNSNRSNGSGYKCERDKLAEHAVVCPRCSRRKVSVTVMVHAVGTLCISTSRHFLMHMNTRENQHWHKHGQQQPRCNMSPVIQFHACKGSTKMSYSIPVSLNNNFF